MTAPVRDTAPVDRARYIMIGGFLGAGKTTAIAQFARYLTDRGLRAGLITNDQSTGLVDTSILRGKGFSVEEIGGGCFCCRFNSLSDAATKLTAQTRPDVFVAEPVGSCTDLVATVSYPLRRIYGDRFTIAPLSVMVDPMRGARIMGVTAGRSFSDKVVYVYRKQLEEANLIVINKCDELTEETRVALERALREAYPKAEVMSVSARSGDGLERWFERLLAEEDVEAPTMALDYQTYAEGEALLGWLNTTVAVEPDGLLDGNAMLLGLITCIRDRLAPEVAEIAHLKATFEPCDGEGQLSVVSLVSSDGEPDVRESLLDRVGGGEMIINLRAEADPELLKAVTETALAEVSRTYQVALRAVHQEHFRPAPPTPTHRITS